MVLGPHCTLEKAADAHGLGVGKRIMIQLVISVFLT